MQRSERGTMQPQREPGVESLVSQRKSGPRWDPGEIQGAQGDPGGVQGDPGEVQGGPRGPR